MDNAIMQNANSVLNVSSVIEEHIIFLDSRI